MPFSPTRRKPGSNKKAATGQTEVSYEGRGGECPSLAMRKRFFAYYVTEKNEDKNLF
jgi:hypothetical protein